MDTNTRILCGSNSYEKKFYLNEEFAVLPDIVKQELQIMCVLYTEEIGGILTLEYDSYGNLLFQVSTREYDPIFDEIGSHLKIKEIRSEKRELLEALEQFYKVLYLGQAMEEE